MIFDIAPHRTGEASPPSCVLNINGCDKKQPKYLKLNNPGGIRTVIVAALTTEVNQFSFLCDIGCVKFLYKTDLSVALRNETNGCQFKKA